jgi:predicted transcriptional regulator
MAGFIKLYRSMKNWGWYKDSITKAVFIHLLLSANFKPNTYKGVLIERGQVPFGRKQLSFELGISEQQVRTALKHLISTNEITIKTSLQGSIATINNYDTYQDLTNDVTNNQPTTNQQLTNNQPLSKKGRKKEGNNIPPISPAGTDKITFAEYVQMKQSEHDKLVERVGEYGAKRCIEILDNYKGANGKKYKNDYRAILNWVIARYEQEPKPEPEIVQYIPPKPEDDAPFRKSLPEGASLEDWLPPATEEYSWK